MVTRELYEHLPKQRALPQDLMNEVKEAITLKANSKLLQQKIETSLGKKFTVKDNANLRQYSKVSFSGSEIKNIAEFLKQCQGSVVEILVDQDKTLKEYFSSIYRCKRSTRSFQRSFLSKLPTSY